MLAAVTVTSAFINPLLYIIRGEWKWMKKRVFNNIVCVQCHHRGRHSRLVLFMLLRAL